MLFGWSLKDCLEMPAHTFFAMRRAGLSARAEEVNSFLLELCDVAAMPGVVSTEYHKNLKEAYRGRLESFESNTSERRDCPVFDAADPDAAKVFMAMCGVNG